MKRLIYILFIFAFLSCGKDGAVVHKGNVMQFSVHAPEVVSTKAEVTVNRLKDRTDQIYIYGVSSDGNSSVPVFPSPGTANLIYESDATVWKPILYKNSEIIEFSWDEAGKLYYQFYAFAFSGNANTGDTRLEISNEVTGRQFTIVQPESAEWTAPENIGGVVDGSGTVDYLLSYLVNVPSPSTGNYPVVDLNLEHAMAKVEVDVQVATSMINMIDNICVEIQGVKRGATMLCLQPKLEGEDGSNSWIVNMNEGLSRASYKVNDIVCSDVDAAETDMSFIAIPVTESEMDGYNLVLTYYNKDDESQTPTYVYEFALKDFSPKGWMSGHRVRYVLTVDNSIHLEGSIVDYQDVDYMEGVMLPDIPGTK